MTLLRLPTITPPRAGLAVLAAFLLSSGALAAVKPEWVRVDVDKDGKQEWVATTNLTDVAFNEHGEIVGWYPKLVKGSKLGEGQYTGNTSITTGPSYRIELPGERGQGKVETTNPVEEAGPLTATFAYQQGEASVEKQVSLNPRQLSVKLTSQVDGVDEYQVLFSGLGAGQPNSKILQRGGTVQSSGEAQTISYASLQCCNNAFGGTGQALVIRPEGNTAVSGSLSTVDKVGRISLTLPGNSETTLLAYGGQNELIRLNLEGLDALPGLFNPNWLGHLSLWLVGLLEFLRSVLGSWGLAIIGLTLIIRLAVWPLLQVQMRSSAEMQAIQPKLKELNEKYKDKPEKKAEATMALYKEHNVNPAASCLPLFVQMPVLIVMWRVIANYEFDQGFLWLSDLSLPDPYYILMVAYVGVNILQLWVATMGNRDMFRQQIFIYLIFVLFVLQLPSGVTLYWVMSTLIAVAQQLMINRAIKARTAASPAVRAR
jgi:YidC/Oxa1 family membrane protein insertase